MKQSMITLRTMLTVLLCAACMTMAYADNPITKKQLMGKWKIESIKGEKILEEEQNININGDVTFGGIIEFKDHGQLDMQIEGNLGLSLEEEGKKIDITMILYISGNGLWSLSQNRLLNSIENPKTDLKICKVLYDGTDITELAGSMMIDMLKEQGNFKEILEETMNHVSSEELTDYTGKTVMMGDIKLTRL